MDDSQPRHSIGLWKPLRPVYRPKAQLTLEDSIDLKLAFDAVDTARVGYLPIDKIPDVIRSTGVAVSETVLNEQLKRLVTSKDGVVSFWEAQKLAKKLKSFNEIHSLPPPFLGFAGLEKYYGGIDESYLGGVPNEIKFLMAGGASIAVSRTCTAPIERVKILLQTAGAGERGSVPSMLRSILQQEGIRGLWTSNRANIYHSSIQLSTTYLAYYFAKRYAVSEASSLSWHHAALIGGAAALLGHTFSYSDQNIRTRMACDIGCQKYPTLAQSDVRLTNNFGKHVSYLGRSTSLAWFLGCTISEYGFFRGLLKQFPQPQQEYQQARLSQLGVLAPLPYAALGATAATLATSVMYPLEVVMRRLQIMEAPPRPYRDGWHAFTKIFQQEGVRGLYRGFGFHLLHAAPTFFTSFYTFRYVMNYFDGLNREVDNYLDKGGKYDPSDINFKNAVKAAKTLYFNKDQDN